MDSLHIVKGKFIFFRPEDKIHKNIYYQLLSDPSLLGALSTSRASRPDLPETKPVAPEICLW
jgi:hypothetical protein